MIFFILSVFILNTSYAFEDFCFYGGWLSKKNSEGKCEHPKKHEEEITELDLNPYGPECSNKNEFRCNPEIFGGRNESSVYGNCVQKESFLKNCNEASNKKLHWYRTKNKVTKNLLKNIDDYKKYLKICDENNELTCSRLKDILEFVDFDRNTKAVNYVAKLDNVYSYPNNLNICEIEDSVNKAKYFEKKGRGFRRFCHNPLKEICETSIRRSEIDLMSLMRDKLSKTMEKSVEKKSLFNKYYSCFNDIYLNKKVGYFEKKRECEEKCPTQKCEKLSTLLKYDCFNFCINNDCEFQDNSASHISFYKQCNLIEEKYLKNKISSTQKELLQNKFVQAKKRFLDNLNSKESLNVILDDHFIQKIKEAKLKVSYEDHSVGGSIKFENEKIEMSIPWRLLYSNMDRENSLVDYIFFHEFGHYIEAKISQSNQWYKAKNCLQNNYNSSNDYQTKEHICDHFSMDIFLHEKSLEKNNYSFEKSMENMEKISDYLGFYCENYHNKGEGESYCRDHSSTHPAGIDRVEKFIRDPRVQAYLGCDIYPENRKHKKVNCFPLK